MTSYAGIPIYLVSLKKDIDRRSALSKRFPLYYSSFYHVEAVDGRKLTSKQYYEYLIPHWKVKHNIISPSEVGCTLSHIAALEQFMLTDQLFALIFEDDVIGNDNDIRRAEEITSFLDQNSLLLCGEQPRYISKKCQFGVKISNELYSVLPFSYSYIFGTFSYIVSRKSAQAIIEHHNKMLDKADSWGSILKDTSIKMYYSSMFTHPEDVSFSQIESERTVQHKGFFQKLTSPDAFSIVLRRLKMELMAFFYRLMRYSKLP